MSHRPFYFLFQAYVVASLFLGKQRRVIFVILKRLEFLLFHKLPVFDAAFQSILCLNCSQPGF